MNNGFIKVASAIPTTGVANCTHNVEHIRQLIDQAAGQGAAIVCFPELSITGYTCADLFAQQQLLDSAQAALEQLLHDTASTPIVAIVGMPIAVGSALLNAAVVIQGGHIHGIVPKPHLPN
jgi:NAD+ synthase (glutamine-hydrolysing)